MQFCCCEENKVVLVTGGAGYIGSHTCKCLKEAGYLPVTYDSLVSGSTQAVQWGPLVIGDLTDIEALDQAFAVHKPYAVLHFAALKSVGESVTDPAIYYTKNIVGTVNLMNAMLKHRVKHIVFSSSCAVYGGGDALIDETRERSPINPYAMSKYIGEKMIEDYGHAYDIDYVIFRYFNAAGFDPSTGVQRAANSQAGVIPKILLSLLDPLEPLRIFGDDYPTPDGSAIRDYIHVQDLAWAHVHALAYLETEKKSDVFNLGTGCGVSVFEVIRAIEQVTGQRVPYVVTDRRAGDVCSAIAAVNKSKEILGFEPLHSDLHEIIESEWASMQY